MNYLIPYHSVQAEKWRAEHKAQENRYADADWIFGMLAFFAPFVLPWAFVKVLQTFGVLFGW